MGNYSSVGLPTDSLAAQRWLRKLSDDQPPFGHAAATTLEAERHRLERALDDFFATEAAAVHTRVREYLVQRCRMDAGYVKWALEHGLIYDPKTSSANSDTMVAFKANIRTSPLWPAAVGNGDGDRWNAFVTDVMLHSATTAIVSLKRFSDSIKAAHLKPAFAAALARSCVPPPVAAGRSDDGEAAVAARENEVLRAAKDAATWSVELAAARKKLEQALAALRAELITEAVTQLTHGSDETGEWLRSVWNSNVPPDSLEQELLRCVGLLRTQVEAMQMEMDAGRT